MTRISSYGSYLTTLQSISSGQSNIDSLSEQLTSGKKSSSLSYYGTQTQRILTLRAEISSRESYSQSIDQATTRIESYNTIMERLADISSELTSTSQMPEGAGSPSISGLQNPGSGNVVVSVNEDASQFMVEATYTVAVVPSETGPAGSYDVTVTDGLGGKSTNTVTLKTVPPETQPETFKISGGPGDGAVISLNVETLSGAGISSFEVSYPGLDTTKELINAMATEIESLLNEKVGDRYLFSGSRYDTQPVDDILADKQTTRVTMVGQRGDVGETYEITLEGQTFTYTTTGNEASMNEVLTNSSGTGLIDQINAYQPAFNVTASASNGIATFSAKDMDTKFSVTTNVYESGSYNNTIQPADNAIDASTAPYTVQAYSETTQQIDEIKLHGNEADIGDAFTISVGAVTRIANEDAPEQVIVAGPTNYSYVVSAADMDILRGNASLPASKAGQDPAYTQPTSAANWVAQNLAVQINADPSSTVTASVDPNDDTKVVLTAKDVNSEFQTTASVSNGDNTNQMVVADLPALANQTDFTSVTTGSKLPFYDTQYETKGSDSSASSVARLQVDSGQVVNYGVTSTDPAIQKLVNALRSLQAAVSTPGKYSELVQDARSLMSDATTELRTVQTRVATANSTIDNVKTRHETAITKATSELSSIEGVDANEVAVKLSSALNTQETAYTVTGTIQSLSLIDYLA